MQETPPLYIQQIKTAVFITCMAFSGCAQVKSPDTTDTSAKQAQAGTEKRSSIIIPTQCQQEVLTPAIFRDAIKKVRVFEGSPVFTNTPATIEWTSKSYVVTPARYAKETVRAEYKDVTEQVEVLKRRVELRGKPATYITTEKPVIVQPAHMRWKHNCVADNTQQCLEQVPERKRILLQKVVDIPARTVQVEIPGKTAIFTRKVLVSPGKGTGALIPEKRADVSSGRVTKVWSITADRQASRYQDVPVKTMLQPAQTKKVYVACSEQLDRTQALAIQRSLRQKRYDAPINGIIDKPTLRAVITFQRDNNLALGALTRQTLNKLGFN